MKDNIYFASFKSNLNNNRESYFLIQDEKIIKQGEGKVVFY